MMLDVRHQMAGSVQANRRIKTQTRRQLREVPLRGRTGDGGQRRQRVRVDRPVGGNRNQGALRILERENVGAIAAGN